MDLYGIKVASLVANALMITAFGVLAATAYGDVSEVGWLIGFVILGSSAIGQLHTLYSISNLFGERPTLVMGMINGCADGSALLFLVFRLIYESGVELGAIFVGYIVGPLLITTCLALFLWPQWPLVPAATGDLISEAEQDESTATKGGWSAKAPSLEDEHADNTDSDPATGPASNENTLLDAVAEHNTDSKAVESAEGHSNDSGNSADENSGNRGTEATVDSSEEAATVPPHSAGEGPAPEHIGELAGVAAATTLAAPSLAYPYLGMTLKQQAASPVFLGLAAFSVVSLFKFSFYLAAFDAQADFLGQDDGEYTTILGIVMACAIAVVPLVGMGIDHHGLHKAVAVNFGLSVAVSIVTLIPNLEIQAFGTVLFLVFRGFVFTVLSGCLAAEFGFANFGALIGSVSFVAGLLGLLISPLFDLSLNTFDGDFTVANSIVAVFTLVVQGPFTWYYWRYRTYRDGETAGTAVGVEPGKGDSSGAYADTALVPLAVAPVEEGALAPVPVGGAVAEKPAVTEGDESSANEAEAEDESPVAGDAAVSNQS